jgi:hypothetical protein
MLNPSQKKSVDLLKNFLSTTKIKQKYFTSEDEVTQYPGYAIYFNEDTFLDINFVRDSRELFEKPYTLFIPAYNMPIGVFKLLDGEITYEFYKDEKFIHRLEDLMVDVDATINKKLTKGLKRVKENMYGMFIFNSKEVKILYVDTFVIKESIVFENITNSQISPSTTELGVSMLSKVVNDAIKVIEPNTVENQYIFYQKVFNRVYVNKRYVERLNGDYYINKRFLTNSMKRHITTYKKRKSELELTLRSYIKMSNVGYTYSEQRRYIEKVLSLASELLSYSFADSSVNSKPLLMKADLFFSKSNMTLDRKLLEEARDELGKISTLYLDDARSFRLLRSDYKYLSREPLNIYETRFEENPKSLIKVVQSEPENTYSLKEMSFEIYREISTLFGLISERINDISEILVKEGYIKTRDQLFNLELEEFLTFLENPYVLKEEFNDYNPMFFLSKTKLTHREIGKMRLEKSLNIASKAFDDVFFGDFDEDFEYRESVLLNEVTNTEKKMIFTKTETNTILFEWFQQKRNIPIVSVNQELLTQLHGKVVVVDLLNELILY